MNLCLTADAKPAAMEVDDEKQEEEESDDDDDDMPMSVVLSRRKHLL